MFEDAIGKTKCTQHTFPKKVLHEKKVITDPDLNAKASLLVLQKLVLILQMKLKTLI